MWFKSLKFSIKTQKNSPAFNRLIAFANTYVRRNTHKWQTDRLHLLRRVISKQYRRGFEYLRFIDEFLIRATWRKADPTLNEEYNSNSRKKYHYIEDVFSSDQLHVKWKQIKDQLNDSNEFSNYRMRTTVLIIK